MGFQNKVVLITGAGRGIGRATAIRFGGKGAKVIIMRKAILKKHKGKKYEEVFCHFLISRIISSIKVNKYIRKKIAERSVLSEARY